MKKPVSTAESQVDWCCLVGQSLKMLRSFSSSQDHTMTIVWLRNSTILAGNRKRQTSTSTKYFVGIEPTLPFELAHGSRPDKSTGSGIASSAPGPGTRPREYHAVISYSPCYAVAINSVTWMSYRQRCARKDCSIASLGETAALLDAAVLIHRNDHLRPRKSWTKCSRKPWFRRASYLTGRPIPTRASYGLSWKERARARRDRDVRSSRTVSARPDQLRVPKSLRSKYNVGPFDSGRCFFDKTSPKRLWTTRKKQTPRSPRHRASPGPQRQHSASERRRLRCAPISRVVASIRPTTRR